MKILKEDSIYSSVDINHEVVDTVNGYQIIRSESKKSNKFTGEVSGRVKVFYDVCDDEDLLDSFKTLAAARKYAKELDPIS